MVVYIDCNHHCPMSVPIISVYHTFLFSSRPQLCTRPKGKYQIKKANSTLGRFYLSGSYVIYLVLF